MSYDAIAKTNLHAEQVEPEAPRALLQAAYAAHIQQIERLALELDLLEDVARCISLPQDVDHFDPLAGDVQAVDPRPPASELTARLRNYTDELEVLTARIRALRLRLDINPSAA